MQEAVEPVTTYPADDHGPVDVMEWRFFSAQMAWEVVDQALRFKATSNPRLYAFADCASFPPDAHIFATVGSDPCSAASPSVRRRNQMMVAMNYKRYLKGRGLEETTPKTTPVKTNVTGIPVMYAGFYFLSGAFLTLLLTLVL